MKIGFTVCATIIVALGIVSCTDDNDSNNSQNVTKSQVILNYSAIVHSNYLKALNDAVSLENAIITFTDSPSAANFRAAKDKWKQARESYGITEAFRFSNGPIDDENGPEGLLNAWPLDENYIDYVDNNGTPLNGGIINNTVAFPQINKAVLTDLNEFGGEKNISIGYHAIEFLLWGQDLTDPADNLPGQRPFTDYVAGGTATNQLRRAAYLNVCADLLTDHLEYLVDEWQIGGTYRSTFLALPENTALQNIYTGIATLAAAELAVERMDVALLNQDQEDEHSCFSDNTHRDIYLNLKGVVNVYQGKFSNIDGPSLEDLVTQQNLSIANETNDAIILAFSNVNAIITPFDLAISQGPTSTEGAKVKAAVLQLQNLGANLISGASSIGINVNTAG